MTVTTICDVGMAKFIHIHLIGQPEAAIIKADTVEDTDNLYLILKRDGVKVGDFRKSEVAGWFIRDTERKTDGLSSA